MKEISISREGKEKIEGNNVDYALTTVLGLIDYSFSSKLKQISMHSCSEYETIMVADDTYEQLKKNFKSYSNIDEIAEFLIWTYLFIGRNI